MGNRVRAVPMFRCFAVVCLAAFTHAAEMDRGVVIESVNPATELAKAGLRAGDTVLSWSAGGARGAIESPFDVHQVGIEYAPRGVVTLRGERGGRPQTWAVNPSTPVWTSVVRPAFTGALLTAYGEASKLADARDVVAAAQRLKSAADARGSNAEPAWLAPWLFFRGAEWLQKEGRWQEADQSYRMALEHASGAAPDVRGQILASRAELMYRRDWAKAAEYIFQALQEFQKLRNPSLATALVTYSRGQILRLSGKLSDAEPFYRGALEISEKVAPGTLAVAFYLNNAGSLAISRNRLIEADGYLRRALTIRRKIAPDTVDALLHNLGSLAFQQDDLIAATTYYEQALALLDRLNPSSQRRVTMLTNLAALAAERGDSDKASAYLERALEFIRKAAPGSFEEATVLSMLSAHRLDLGDRAGAEQRQREALEIRTKLAPDSLLCAQSLTRLGTLAAGRRENARAEEYHRRALAIRERLAPQSSLHADSLLRIGTLLRAEGRAPEATKMFAAGLDMLERAAMQSRDESVSDARARFVANYRDYIELLADQNLPEEAFLALERSRARGFVAMLAERQVSVKSGIPAPLEKARQQNYQEYAGVQNQLLNLSPAKDAARIEELGGRLRALDIQRDQIAAEIRASHPRLAAIEYPQPLSVQQTRAALDLGSVLLSYSTGANRTLLFVVSPGGAEPALTVRSLAIGRDQLQARVEPFRQQIEAKTPDRTALSAASRELYDLLVKPVEQELARAARIVIAPDGPLHGLPFAALMRNDNEYLVEWKPVHHVLSASVYAELKKTRRSEAAAKEVLAVGDPRPPRQTIAAAGPLRNAAQRGTPLGRLPFSRDEVIGIAKLHPGSVVYLQSDATEERVKSALPKARTIHFATHAILDDRLPMNAALVLSVPDRRIDGQENGLLQAWEIFEQVQLDADLVVLSACRTGLGKELMGEGLIGLTRAFQYAGARSVIASLWSVDDRKTADLMRLFYLRRRDGASKDAALQEAQREMIRSKANHPYYWAAFSLSGDWM